MFEWLATHHADIKHVADPTNQGNGNVRFARFYEWQEMEKSAMGYPRVVMPALLTGVNGYDYSGMHSDSKAVTVRIYDRVNTDTNTHGFDSGEAAMVKCEMIWEEFKRKLVDWKDNDPAMGGFVDVLGRMDMERIPYKELGPKQLGDGCYGVEISLSFVYPVDIIVDGTKWV